MATTDGLTGLLSRSGLLIYVERLLLQGECEISVIFADGQDFKLINDTFGYEMGDLALSIYAKVLMASTRNRREEVERARNIALGSEAPFMPLVYVLADSRLDGVGRWGGEEFVIVLPAGEHTASMVIERIQMGFDAFASSILRLNLGSATGKVKNIADFYALTRKASAAMKVAKAEAKANPEA